MFKPEYKRPKNEKAIVELAVKAKALGMSYGELVANTEKQVLHLCNTCKFYKKDGTCNGILADNYGKRVDGNGRCERFKRKETYKRTT